MSTHNDGNTFSGIHSAHGLTIDVDIDGTFPLVHASPRNEDEHHVFALRHADSVALLDFLETPQGLRIAARARTEHAAVMSMSIGTLVKLAREADIERELVSIATLPALVRRLSHTSRA